VDEIDRSLLHLLREDARLPMAELGRRVGLSRTATLVRVRRLEDSGAIRGYHADVREASAEPSHVARVGLVVQTPDVAAYARRLHSLPEVAEVEAVAGEYDLLLRVAAASATRLDEILDRISSWRETVRTTTFLVLRRYPAGS
jgi:DNA-binding Lrp family transcriptional regulator